MDTWNTLINLVVLLGVAAVLGTVFERLRQSAILGYLLAGTLLGPGGLHLVQNASAVEILAELGVALLLFTIGLEFSLQRLRSLGSFALFGGTLQIAITTLLFGGIALGLGAPPSSALAIGLLAAPSSTACVLRLLRDRAELDSVHGRGATGILLLQDLALVPLVIILTSLRGGQTASEAFQSFLVPTALFVALFVGLYLLSSFVLPRVLHITGSLKNREMLILVATVIAMGSTWAAHAFRVSPALGAFVAGLLLAGSPFAAQLRADVTTLRTLFVTLFFTSIGMLADLGWIAEHWEQVVIATMAILIGKSIVIAPLGRLFRFSWGHSVAIALSLSQVGEFSFVLGDLALRGGILTEFNFNLVVTSTVVTMFLTPFLVSIAPRIRDRFRGIPSSRKGDRDLSETEHRETAGHIVVIGYGPAGQQIVSTLHSRSITVHVIDMNPAGIERAKRDGVAIAQIGDAVHEDILEMVHLREARAAVVTVPDHVTALSIIRAASDFAPRVPMFARARYSKYAPDFVDAGVRVTVDEEETIGRELASRILTECK